MKKRRSGGEGINILQLKYILLVYYICDDYVLSR